MISISPPKQKYLNLAIIFSLFFSQFMIIEGIPKLRIYFGAIFILSSGIKLLTYRVSRKTSLLILSIFIILLISTINSSRESLIMSFIFLFAISDLDVETIYKYGFISGTIGFFTTISVYLLTNGVSLDNYVQRTMLGQNFIVLKESLGYAHANLVFMVLFVIVTMYYYLRFDRISFIEKIFVHIIVFIFFALTFSRTGLMTYLAFVVFFEFFSNKRVSEKLIQICKNSIIVLTVSLSFILPILYKQTDLGFIKSLNRSLSDRLSYSYQFLDTVGFSFFGFDTAGLMRPEGGVLTADNSFVLTYGAYGFIVFILIILLLSFVLKNNYSRKDAIIIVAYFIYCFSEAFFVNAVFNISLIIIAKDIIIVCDDRLIKFRLEEK